ncbi:MAG: hypothetical protein ACOX7H_09285 [Bacillota bacterium]
MNSFVVSAAIAAGIVALRKPIAESDGLAWLVTGGVIAYSIVTAASI